MSKMQEQFSTCKTGILHIPVIKQDAEALPTGMTDFCSDHQGMVGMLKMQEQSPKMQKFSL
ncbi:hypothetical protein [Methylomarinum vadi]|uniref:hypothetical protein n=1 Tax=Methylomarinum vadi TaxID=438855 RepID=UPI0012696DA1|nr:hypothetical protein [Methylomarinum vadi]